jgi:mRNA interferase MazF
VARVRPQRGDVFWVILDPTVGSEIQKTRPAVIVSNDSCNAFGARVVVVPITSNVTSLFPGEAKITVAGREGRVLGDQLRSVDKARLGKRIGRLLRSDLDAVDDALRTTLDLRGP